jgi:hypothetical protein
MRPHALRGAGPWSIAALVAVGAVTVVSNPALIGMRSVASRAHTVAGAKAISSPNGTEASGPSTGTATTSVADADGSAPVAKTVLANGSRWRISTPPSPTAR